MEGIEIMLSTVVIKTTEATNEASRLYLAAKIIDITAEGMAPWSTMISRTNPSIEKSLMIKKATRNPPKIRYAEASSAIFTALICISPSL